MSTPLPTSILEGQVAELLQRVVRFRETRCRELESTAETQRAAILHAARSEARAQVHATVLQERSRAQQGLRRAEARSELEARERAQDEMRQLLVQMWAEIADLLARNWREAPHRRRWAEAALDTAGALLAGRSWTLACGGTALGTERAQLEAYARQKGAACVTWAQDDTVQAGLRIHSQGVCIDATVAGLLADRDHIESTFLAEYAAAGTRDHE